VNLKDNDTSMNMASVVKISKAKEKRTLDLVEATRTILKEATSRFKTSNMMYN
jgi:predicted GTPase